MTVLNNFILSAPINLNSSSIDLSTLSLSARTDLLAAKYPKVQKAKIEAIEQADPQRGKSTEWIVRQVNNRAIRWPEDQQRVLQALESFYKIKQSPRTLQQYQANPDLSTYTIHTLEDLDDKARNVVARPESKLNIPQSDVKKIYDDGVYSVIQALTAEVACELAKGTKWCTANKVTAAHYLKGRGLYIWFKNGKKFGQSNGRQFMKLDDTPVAPTDPEIINVFLKLFKRLPAGTPKSALDQKGIDQSLVSPDISTLKWTHTFASVAAAEEWAKSIDSYSFDYIGEHVEESIKVSGTTVTVIFDSSDYDIDEYEEEYFQSDFDEFEERAEGLAAYIEDVHSKEGRVEKFYLSFGYDVDHDDKEAAIEDGYGRTVSWYVLDVFRAIGIAVQSYDWKKISFEEGDESYEDEYSYKIEVRGVASFPLNYKNQTEVYRALVKNDQNIIDFQASKFH